MHDKNKIGQYFKCFFDFTEKRLKTKFFRTRCADTEHRPSHRTSFKFSARDRRS